MTTRENPMALDDREEETLELIRANPQLALDQIRLLQNEVRRLSKRVSDYAVAESWRTNPDQMGR